MELTAVIRNTLEQTIVTELLPRSQIDVFLQVLQADGGTRCACINAAMLALADAGVSLQAALLVAPPDLSALDNSQPLLALPRYLGNLARPLAASCSCAPMPHHNCGRCQTIKPQSCKCRHPAARHGGLVRSWLPGRHAAAGPELHRGQRRRARRGSRRPPQPGQDRAAAGRQQAAHRHAGAGVAPWLAPCLSIGRAPRCRTCAWRPCQATACTGHENMHRKLARWMSVRLCMRLCTTRARVPAGQVMDLGVQGCKKVGEFMRLQLLEHVQALAARQGPTNF